jgi:aspartyl-tRNA(Asn)/glutamyl-tRNA(Gln) amidotransferase subunit A
MSLDAWLQSAIDDATRRGLPGLEPLLQGLAQSTRSLRTAAFNLSAVEQGSGEASSQLAPEARFSGPGSATPSTRPSTAHEPTHLPSSNVRLSLDEFGRRLRSGRTSSVETTEACLEAIERRDGELNAFVLVTADDARRRAREVDAELAAGVDRGPLHGVPISLKDLFDVRGLPTTAASDVRRGHIASHDAAAVIQLQHAGAVIIGKTNLHEFAFGTTNEDSAFGPARHPLDPARSPGGSSGGSAISVAAGMALATLGTDTGGSIRIPAAACGLVGLKPTVGEISTDGVVPLSHTLDHVGPLASSVSDAWYVYQVLKGQVAARPLTATGLTGLKIGIPRRYFCDLLEPDLRAIFDRSIETLERAGARVAPCEIADAEYIAAVYLQIVFAEAAAYHAATLESMPERYTAPVRLRLEMARYVLAEDYLRAQVGRATLCRQVDAALSWHDLLVLPTLPIVAPRIGEPSAVIDGTSYPVRNLMLRLTQLFNLTGHPAVSLPCGLAAGLPVGLQVVGRRHDTAALMHAALAIERAIGG